MTQINSFKDLVFWQVSIDLADVCFDIVEAIQHPYRFIFANQLLPATLLAKSARLIDPIGKMIHGLSESLETRAQLGR